MKNKNAKNKMMKIIAVILLLMLKFVNSYQMNNYYYGNNENDRKYVNSGQSIILVCDLPTNMPDGPVSVMIISRFNTPCILNEFSRN